MKIIIVAPGIAPPWTEGRKNFVRDLLPKLGNHWQIHLLTTCMDSAYPFKYRFPVPVTILPVRYRGMQYFSLHLKLVRLIREIKPDIILHFPYGTFDGLRGHVNRYSLKAVHRICYHHQLPCLSILYSMTRGNLNKLEIKITPLATAPTYNWSGFVVHQGIEPSRFPSIPKPTNNRTLLFMAGMQENNRRLLKNILFERGLIEVIKAGQQLARHQFRLSIAIPMLRYAERRIELESYLSSMAPDLSTCILTKVVPQQVLSDHSIYIFPYQKNLRVFIPTSVLEAMVMGAPVLLSQLPMVSALSKHYPPICSFYEAGNPVSLVESVLKMTQNWETTLKRSARAAQYVRKYWSVQHASEQICQIIGSVIHYSNK